MRTWAKRKKSRTGRQTAAELVRLVLEAARILAEEPIRLAELAERLGVGLRQAYRLLYVLRELGLKAEEKRTGKERYWHTSRRELARWLRSVGAVE